MASDVLNAMGKDQKAAGILGWISLGTGLLASAIEIVPRIRSALASNGRGLQLMDPRRPGVPDPGSPIPPIRAIKNKPMIILSNVNKDVVYHQDYLGLGSPAFQTHGGLDGTLMNLAGIMRPAKEVAVDIENFLQIFNHPPGEGFTLLACCAGKSGAAQEVANVTRRTVSAYIDPITVRHLDEALSVVDTPASTNIPLVQKSWWRYFFRTSGYTDSPYHEIAPSRLFFPQ
ncbi:hypothetical protein D3C76_1256350 [compost metagenome]